MNDHHHHLHQSQSKGGPWALGMSQPTAPARLARLRERIERGRYAVPADEVALAVSLATYWARRTFDATLP